VFFEDIQAFVSVVRSGSFSKAAVDLCTAQSALSKRVKRLESRMGTVLLQRHARGIHMTESGRVFLAKAEKIVDEVAAMENDLSSFIQEPVGTVRIALPQRTSGLLGPRVLARKLAELPHVTLEILEGSPSSIHGWLSRGEVDIALAYNDEVGPGFQVDPVLTEPLHLFCKHTVLHEIFAGEVPTRLSMQDLCKIPLILPRRPHVVRVMLDRLCALNNLRPNVIFETDGAVTIRGIIEHGLGGTVFSLSMSAWSHLTQDGLVVAIPFKSPLVCWNLFLVKSKDVENLVAVNRIHAILGQEIDELVRAGAWPQATRLAPVQAR
jgi:LysR family nitrogen assimilation transcriptional regulator